MVKYFIVCFLRTTHQLLWMDSWFSSTRTHLVLQLLDPCRYWVVSYCWINLWASCITKQCTPLQVPQLQPGTSAGTLLPMVLFQNLSTGPPNSLLQVAVKNNQQPVWYFNDKISLLAFFTEDGKMERASFLEVNSFSISFFVQVQRDYWILSFKALRQNPSFLSVVRVVFGSCGPSHPSILPRREEMKLYICFRTWLFCWNSSRVQ